MNPGIAFEAAGDAAGAIAPGTDPLLFALAATLVTVIVLLLLLGGRANRGTGELLRRSDGLVSARDGGEGGPHA